MAAQPPEESHEPPTLSSEAERRLEEIVQQFLDDWIAGKGPDRQAIVAAYPDLMPLLERRLRFVELVAWAARGEAAPAASSTPDEARTEPNPPAGDGGSPPARRRPSRGLPRERAFHLHCPHCGSPIQVVQPEVVEVTCRNCGSTFQVDSGATATFPSVRQPKQIGRFEVLELLGRGGFGVVYKARDPHLDRLVAVKVPRAGYFDSDEEEERFLREARHAARLRHPRIVQIYEVARENGLPYIVSEFIEGLNLADIMSGRRLSFREAAQLVAQIADVLDFAHREKVIHRDIKPSNVLIDSTGNAYLCDFGLARRSEGEFTITLQGEVIGTPTYMSPEQASGEFHRLDGRSDVYSLGVVMYRLLTGELPFRGSRRMLLHQVLHEEPRPPRRVNEHISRDLETICLKGMAKEPDKRYSTARDMADDLRRWLNGEPIRARPIGKLERLVRWRRRNPLIANLMLTIAFLLIAAAAAAGLGAWHEHALRTIADQERKNAEVARGQAQRNAEESHNRLVQAQLTHGTERLEQGDWFASLSWFASAGKLAQRDPYGESLHRLRIGSILGQCPKLTQLWVVGGDVRSIDFSADGQRMLAAAEDGKTGRAGVWHVETGQLVGKLWQPGDRIWHASLSPDGQHVAVGCTNGTIHVWNVETGELAYPPVRHGDEKTEGWVEQVWFSRDGRLLLTASLDHTARLWNAASGQVIRELKHDTKVYHARFSPDETRIVTAGGNKVGEASEARVWTAESGVPIGDPMKHDEFIWTVTFSPDGKRILITDQGGIAQMWDGETAKVLPFRVEHGVPVQAAAFSPDGRFVATGSSDGLVRLWHADSGKPAARAMRHLASVLRVAFAPDGRSLVSACADHTARRWDVTHGWPIDPWLRHAADVLHATFDGSGRFLVTAGTDGTVKRWDLATAPTWLPPLQHDRSVQRAMFSFDGRRVATASNDGTVKVWNATDGTLLTQAPLVHEDPRRVMGDGAFSPDGSRLATASYDGTIMIWDTRSYQRLLGPLRHSEGVRQIAFNARGDRLVSASDDKTARIWNTSTGELVAELRHDGPVMFATFSPDGSFVATASQDKTARIWRADNGSPVGDPVQHDDWVMRVAFSPDGRRLLSTGHNRDKRVSITDLASRRRLDIYHTGSVHSGLFSSDGRWLLTAAYDGDVVVWDSFTGQRAGPALNHRGAATTSAKFSSDGRLVVTTPYRRGVLLSDRAWGNGAAELWEVATGFPITLPLPHRARINSAVLSPDDQQLVTASDDGTAQLWHFRPEKRPWEDVEALAQLLSSQVVEPALGLRPLSSHRLDQVWQMLRTKYPASFQTSPAELKAWRKRTTPTS